MIAFLGTSSAPRATINLGSGSSSCSNHSSWLLRPQKRIIVATAAVAAVAAAVAAAAVAAVAAVTEAVTPTTAVDRGSADIASRLLSCFPAL